MYLFKKKMVQIIISFYFIFNFFPFFKEIFFPLNIYIYFWEKLNMVFNENKTDLLTKCTKILKCNFLALVNHEKK